jgi:hypothetical protein
MEIYPLLFGDIKIGRDFMYNGQLHKKITHYHGFLYWDCSIVSFDDNPPIGKIEKE